MQKFRKKHPKSLFFHNLRVRLQTIFSDFWKAHPALLYGISTFLGAVFALCSLSLVFLSIIAILIYLPLIISSKQAATRAFLAILFGCAALFLFQTRYQFPENLPFKDGRAEVDIDGVSLSKTPFGNIWKYKGTLKSYFIEGQDHAKGIPVEIFLPEYKKHFRPLSGFKYELQASLKATPYGKYILKPDNNFPWATISHLNSIAELRMQTKAALKKHMEESVKDHHVREFLTGIATGEFEDSELSIELGRFGLQHLTAISGLHFSILATFLGFAFCLVLPRQIAWILVVVFMTLYFIFLGASPSVTRAYATITIALAALILSRQSSALNSLGIALLIVLIVDPLSIHYIGFQFSFAITLSILLWNKPCEQVLKKVFPGRVLSQTIKMTTLDQHGIVALHFLRKALALCMAVNLTALPLTIFHFHKFPMIGLLYNLFFPTLVTISLLLLLLALKISAFFSPLAASLHVINEQYTKAVLNLGFHFPKSLDVSLTISEISTELIAAYLFSLFYLGIFFGYRSRSDMQI